MKKFEVTHKDGKKEEMDEMGAVQLMYGRTPAYISMLRNLKVNESVFSQDTGIDIKRIQ